MELLLSSHFLHEFWGLTDHHRLAWRTPLPTEAVTSLARSIEQMLLSGNDPKMGSPWALIVCRAFPKYLACAVLGSFLEQRFEEGTPFPHFTEEGTEANLPEAQVRGELPSGLHT